MAVVTGSVAVEVVPDATGWERRVRAQVLPDASKLGAEYGKLFGAAATKAIGDSVSVGVERSSRGAERKAPEQGAKVAGKFAEAFKSRLTAALKNLVLKHTTKWATLQNGWQPPTTPCSS